MRDAGPDTTTTLVRTALVFELAIGAIALGLAWFLPVDPLAAFRGTWQAIVAGVLATIPLLALFLLTWRWPLGPFRTIREKIERLLIPGFRGASLLDLALVSIAAGLGEELLFRGFLQALLEAPLGAAGALAVASVAFGLAHAVSVGYAVVATVVGAYLGLLWMGTGDLLAPVVCHALYDFVALAVLTRAPASAR